MIDNKDSAGNAGASELVSFRNKFTRQFVFSYWILFAMLQLSIILIVFIIATDQVTAEPVEKMALVASMQVSIGIFIGFVSLFLGFMMAWIGIEAAFAFQADADGGGPKTALSLQSASPGLLFALLGAALIIISLHKDIGYEVTGPSAGMQAVPEEHQEEAEPEIDKQNTSTRKI